MTDDFDELKAKLGLAKDNGDPPLRMLISIYTEWVKDKANKHKFDWDEFGQICFEWLHAHGKFFVDGEVCYLDFRNRTYKIGSNMPFRSLLHELAELNAATNGARIVMESIKCLAYQKGDHTAAGSRGPKHETRGNK